MGKPGKLFKSLVAGVKVFKSPSEESPANEKSTPTNKKEDKDYMKKRSKDKCFGSLGKSSSRSRDLAACASFPDAIDIKCVQMESEKLKDVLPMSDPLSTDARAASMKAQCAGNTDSACNQATATHFKEFMTTSDREAWAASKIQAAFRCYLAQRAFRALKAVVRLQALVRGQVVRRQASVSLRCMNAVIRLQALARGHRVRNSELGQLVQKHLQQTKQSRKKPAEGWVNSLATAQQLHAKAQSKQDAVTKRQRALVYAFSEQLNRRTQKQSPSSRLDNQVDKSHWIWVWLERWSEATSKGSSITAPAEERSPVTNTKLIEKPKTSTKAGKFSESSRKEGKKVIEHTDGVAPPLQRGLFPEDKEKATNAVTKKEERSKAVTESEKPSHRKSSLPGSISASSVTQKPSSSPPPSSMLPLSTKEESPLATKELSLPATQLPFSSEVSVGMQPTSPSCADESKVATQSNPSDGSLQAATCDIYLAGAGMTTRSQPTPTQQVRPLNTSSSPNGSASPTWKSISNSLSTFSFSPSEVCSPTALLHNSSTELGTSRVSALHTPSEQANTSSSHSSSTPDLLVHEGSSSGAPTDEAVLPLDNRDNVSEGVITSTRSGENGVHEPEETIDHLNGDWEMHTLEDGMSEDASAEPVVNEDTDCKNQLGTHTDALSETNGVCDSSVVSIGDKSADVFNKLTTSPGSKNEQHTECVSPSVPSYMATTKSSQAKVRLSPKLKLESPTQKLDSPKLKLDVPKAKGDSPTQKPHCSMKRRQSLSALDGKVSSGFHKPVVHVRANSRGNLSSLKDLSTDNLALSNGNSCGHGK